MTEGIATFPVLDRTMFGDDPSDPDVVTINVRANADGIDALASIQAVLERGDLCIVHDPDFCFPPFGLGHFGGSFVTTGFPRGRGNFATLEAALRYGLTCPLGP